MLLTSLSDHGSFCGPLVHHLLLLEKLNPTLAAAAASELSSILIWEFFPPVNFILFVLSSQSISFCGMGLVLFWQMRILADLS